MPEVPKEESKAEPKADDDVPEQLPNESEIMQETVPDLDMKDGDVNMDDDAAGALDAENMTWDESCVVVRQGQLYIELMHRNPPMGDDALQVFCDWLDSQMPIVVKNFPYVRRSGAYIDLSDNKIGPEGLDKLFRVLRDHKVPCTVMKAYRNLLDDSIVDTIIEYLYTQPESYPMHGVHISHNNITDKGALRLIKAAAQCGHYPRLTTRLPLWLRLECNSIETPQKVVTDCEAENFNVCLMGDGQCSRPGCNHYSGVHVQLPYFFHQKDNKPEPRKGGFKGKSKSKGKAPTCKEFGSAGQKGEECYPYTGLVKRLNRKQTVQLQTGRGHVMKRQCRQQ